MKSDRNHVYLKKSFLSFLAALFLAFMVNGCASVSEVMQKTQNIASPILSLEKHLKKKVGVAAVGNISEVGDRSIASGLQALLEETLSSDCDSAIIVKPENNDALKFLKALPSGESGSFDNLTISEKGRSSGLNAIVTATIVGVHKSEKKSGFAWFKESENVAEIIVRVDIYNTCTGAKMMHENFSREIQLKEEEVPVFDSGKIMEIGPVSKAMGQISKDIGKTICKTLKNEPWKGLVVSSDNDSAVLSSGEDVGIKVGDKFIVYEKFTTVDGINGHRYRIPGTVTDELEVTSVGSDRAEGISLSGNTIPTGSIVQFKKK